MRIFICFNYMLLAYYNSMKIKFFFADMHRPYINILPSNTVVRDSAVIVECVTTSSVAVNYTWFKDDTILLPTTKRFQIENAVLEDEGNYSCTIANRFHKLLSEKSNLLVYCKYYKGNH